MTITKVIFLDFDGPLLPARAYFLPANKLKPWDQFDPIAISLVKTLLDESDAKIVLSTSWALRGDKAIEALERNGISSNYLHSNDAVTPRSDNSTRYQEVYEWLNNHPEITHWVAFDDYPDLYLSSDGSHQYPEIWEKGKWIQVDFDDGILWKHYSEARDALELKKNMIIG